MSKMLMGLLCCMLFMIACSDDDTGGTGGTGGTSSFTVQYRMSGTGAVASASINVNYMLADGNPATPAAVSLPWQSTSFSSTRLGQYSVSGSGSAADGNLTLEVWIDGSMVCSSNYAAAGGFVMGSATYTKY